MKGKSRFDVVLRERDRKDGYWDRWWCVYDRKSRFTAAKISCTYPGAEETIRAMAARWEVLSETK
jgi:hypothetical protein